MRVARLLTVLIFVSPLTSACSTGIRPEALQAWVGRPAAALEKDWGPPTREARDGELRILVYEEMERRSGSSFEGAASAFRRGATQTAPEDTYRSPTVYVRSYLFWVNAEGKIVRAMVRTP